MAENVRTTQTGIRLSAGPERRAFFFMFGLSFLFHTLVLGVLIWRPVSHSYRRLPGPVVDVRLVSLPGPAPVGTSAAAASSVKKTPKTTPAKKAAAVQEPTKKKPRAKVPMKKQTFQPEKIVQDAIRKIEQKVETRENETDRIDEAIERLKEQVGKREQEMPMTETGASATGVAGGVVGGGGGGGGGGAVGILDLYRYEIAHNYVNKNWAFSESLAGRSGNPAVKIVFRVLPDGEIRDIRYIEKSGNRFLDEAAYRAIAKSNPVRPHPPGISQRYVEVALRFTPEGIR